MKDSEIENTGEKGGKSEWLIIAALAIYTGLLMLGTIGELFDIDWIMKLPIFRGP